MYRPLGSLDRMKTLLIGTLLAVIPTASMRIICFPGPSQATESVRASDGRGCEMICSRHAPTRARTRCVLVEDPSCGFALASPVAIMPATTALVFVRTVRPFDLDLSTAYRFSSLDPASPPPR
jgi:hypothetical protein